MDLYARSRETADFINERFAQPVKTSVLTGTGIDLRSIIDVSISIPYVELPYFTDTTVASHSGSLLLGYVDTNPVAIWQGRFHYYEGLPLSAVTYPIRVMATMQHQHVIVLNASGSVNPEVEAGSLVLLSDHINFMQRNPLIGPNEHKFGPRFPDMTAVYDGNLRTLARAAADELDILLKEGIYLALPGPSLETPAEYRMIRNLGADLVGMSTVPEVIVARHAGLRVLGISIATNFADPKHLAETTIEDVIATADQASQRLRPLLRNILTKI